MQKTTFLQIFRPKGQNRGKNYSEEISYLLVLVAKKYAGALAHGLGTVQMFSSLTAPALFSFRNMPKESRQSCTGGCTYLGGYSFVDVKGSVEVSTQGVL